MEIKVMRIDIYKTNNNQEGTGLVPAGSAALETAAQPGLDRHPVAVFLARLSPGSRRVHLQALNVIAGILSAGREDARSFGWAGLRYQHTAAVRSVVRERYAPATARRMMSAMCGVITEAWRLGLISSEDCERAKDLEPVRGQAVTAGRSLGAGELRSLFESCAQDKKPALGARDAALLAILYGAGLRRSEAVSLSLCDWRPDEEQLIVHFGKGNKSRSVPVPTSAVPAIDRWISFRGTADEDRPLLFPLTKGGKICRRRMTDHAVLKALRSRALKAGVANFTPHDMRRTFISDLLDHGADLAITQQLAGHASPKTTAAYDRRPAAARKKAVDLLHVPVV